MASLKPALRAILRLFVLAPWLWLASFIALAISATLHLGRLPSYGNPDPKTLPEIWLPHQSTWLLLALAALSPLIVEGYLALCLACRRRTELALQSTAVHATGLVAMVATVYADPFGLSNWFFD